MFGFRNSIQTPKRLGSNVKFSDSFNRADSTTTLGANWTVATGTWGIRSNKAYTVTDASGDLVWRDIGTNSYTVSASLTGEYNTNFRYPTIVLHYVDANNYIFAYFDSNQVILRKRAAGTNTTLTSTAFAVVNGNTYNIKVSDINGVITVYADGVQKLNYTLTTDEKTTYQASTKVGMRITKSGTPTNNADFDNFLVTV